MLSYEDVPDSFHKLPLQKTWLLGRNESCPGGLCTEKHDKNLKLMWLMTMDIILFTLCVMRIKFTCTPSPFRLFDHLNPWTCCTTFVPRHVNWFREQRTSHVGVWSTSFTNNLYL